MGGGGFCLERCGDGGGRVGCDLDGHGGVELNRLYEQ